MIPQFAYQLFFTQNQPWPDNQYFLQARTQFDAETNAWLIEITKDMPAVALNKPVQQEAKAAHGFTLPTLDDIRKNDGAAGATSLLSGTGFLAVTTIDNPHVSYYTLRRDNAAKLAPNHLTVASGFCSHNPQKAISNETDEEVGLHFIKDGKLHRVSTASKSVKELQKMYAAQADNLRKNADTYFPDNALDFSNVRPHYARSVPFSKLYTPIHLKVEDGNGRIHTSSFQAFAHPQPPINDATPMNTLNLATIYQADLKCNSDDVFAIDPEKFGRAASLKSIDELRSEEFMLSFCEDFFGKQIALESEFKQANQTNFSPVF